MPQPDMVSPCQSIVATSSRNAGRIEAIARKYRKLKSLVSRNKTSGRCSSHISHKKNQKIPASLGRRGVADAITYFNIGFNLPTPATTACIRLIAFFHFRRASFCHPAGPPLLASSFLCSSWLSKKEDGYCL